MYGSSSYYFCNFVISLQLFENEMGFICLFVCLFLWERKIERKPEDQDSDPDLSFS